MAVGPFGPLPTLPPRQLVLARKHKRALQGAGLATFTICTALASFSQLTSPTVLYGLAGASAFGLLVALVGQVAREPVHVPTLVFVSEGGTCRDPMAKAIMDSLMAGSTPSIRICASALRAQGHDRASRAARYVVREKLGSDALEGHRPVQLEEELLANADLVLTMTDDHARVIRKNFPSFAYKIRSLRSLQGGVDIEDPWKAPDEFDDATIDRYRYCYDQLQEVLERNLAFIRRATLS